MNKSSNYDLPNFKALYELTATLRELQSDYNQVHDRQKNQQSLDAFLTWLQENDVGTTDLVIKETSNTGFGVFAQNEIQINKTIVQVPLSMMITSIPSTPVLENIVKSDMLLSSVPMNTLILQLLIEDSNRESFWRPYLDILPEQFTLPMYFNPDQMNLLKHSSILQDAIKDNFNSVRQYLHFSRLLFLKYKLIANPHFTFERFQWARAICLTRQNPIFRSNPENQQESHLALIPLYDMFNHSNGTVTSFYDMNNSMLEMKSQFDVKIGDEILMTYGARSNQELFLYSGFVDQDTIENDYIKLSVMIPANDTCAQDRKDLLSKFGLTIGEKINLRHGEPLTSSPKLFSFLYGLLIGKEELKKSLIDKSFTASDSLNQKCKTWLIIKIRVMLKGLKQMKLLCCELMASSHLSKSNCQVVCKGEASEKTDSKKANMETLVSKETNLETGCIKLIHSLAKVEIQLLETFLLSLNKA
ncbi:hypothetical protein BC833DRAFT_582724 [Globomyces pollinis-pini]|nr:hypothetical protein BC833DRAFT_582724 [Globomyces pollinis-pini]